MNRNRRFCAGKRRIVKRNLSMNAETIIVERKDFHVYGHDWHRGVQRHLPFEIEVNNFCFC